MSGQGGFGAGDGGDDSVALLFSAGGGGGAGLGGAVFVSGPGYLQVFNSTFSGNVAEGGTGGATTLLADGENGSGLGGAIFNVDGTTYFTGVTFMNNSADAGADAYNLGVEGVDGIVDAWGLLSLEQLIAGSSLASNLVNDTQALQDVHAQMPLANSITTNAVDNRGGISSATNVIVGDPLLGSLANNGGGTATHYPQEGSPAIDAIGSSILNVDQRGVERPQGAAWDIGAVELGVAPPVLFCGDGNTDPAEECDDANTVEGDGCSLACEATCPVFINLTACYGAAKANVVVDERKPGKEKLKASLKGIDEALDASAFGDPTLGDSYRLLCLYDIDGLFVDERIDRGGEVCGPKAKPCWKAQKNGFGYKDPLAESSGVTNLTEKGGAAGKGSVTLEAKNNVAKGLD